MKKLVVLLTVLILTTTLAACGETETPVVCNDGYSEVEGECVKDIPTCSVGYSLVGTECVKDSVTCDPGYSEVDGECEKDPVVCEDGFTLVGDDCIADEPEDEDPVISGATDFEITIGDTFDDLLGVTANDTEDGVLTASITISGTVDISSIGIYIIVYSVTDSASNTTQVSRTITVKGLDGCPVHYELVDGLCVKLPAEIITIMHGAIYEIDPFHEDYSGTQQAARRTQQREIELQYNVIINYENYPANAGWGPTRVQAIIQASVSGEPLSDIYWVTSDWIQDLVNGNSIADVSQYLSTSGANIPDAYHDIGEYQGGVYGFESYKPSINGGLYYNADLVSNLGITNPTQLYLDGNWNWTVFEQWSTAVQTALDGEVEEMYALGGMFSYYATAMTTLLNHLHWKHMIL